MTEYLLVGESIAILRSELRFTFSRSPGPGGQNVNKVNSKATLHWAYLDSPCLPEAVRQRMGRLLAKRTNERGELVLSSSQHREQRRNVEECLLRLKHLVQAAAVPPQVRKKRTVSAAAKVKRLQEKRWRGEKKRLRRPPSHED